MIDKWVTDRDSDPAEFRMLQQERLFVHVTELIAQTMEEQGITNSQLADLIGKSRPQITRILCGDSNLTLRTIADVFTAMGFELCVGVRQLAGDAIEESIFDRSTWTPPPKEWPTALDDQNRWLDNSATPAIAG